MGEYLALCQFQPIQIAAQEDEHIALLPPAGVSILLKKIRFGTGSTQGDLPVRIRVRRVSAAGSGGTTAAFTPVKVRDDSPASVTGVLVKSASGFRVPGANVDLVMNVTMIHRSTFEWVARDWRDFIESGVNQRIIISLEIGGAGNTSNNFMEVWWLE